MYNVQRSKESDPLFHWDDFFYNPHKKPIEDDTEKLMFGTQLVLMKAAAALGR